MNFLERTCQHLNEVVDEREGNITCIDCGLVMENYFSSKSLSEANLASPEYKYVNYLKDLFDKLNISQVYIPDILKVFNERYEHKKKTQNLLCCALEILNNNRIPVCVKEFEYFTGYRQEEIFKNQNSNSKILIPMEECFEKYCKLLNLSFTQYKDIYKCYLSHKKSGHQPLTIIGGFIYQYVRKLDINIQLEDIASLLGISKLSILRFCKNEFNI